MKKRKKITHRQKRKSFVRGISADIKRFISKIKTLINNRKSKKVPPQPVRPITEKSGSVTLRNNSIPVQEPEAQIKVSIETGKSEERIERIIDMKYISPVDIGYICPSGGYMNIAQFRVTGTNGKTNRKITTRYEAKDEAGVINMAMQDGIHEPFDVEPIPWDAATERQLKYLESLGVDTSLGFSKTDAREIISRIVDRGQNLADQKMSDGKIVSWVNPERGPSIEFAQFADDSGVIFSMYSSFYSLLDRVVYSLEKNSQRDRNAFYAYCVICNSRNAEIGDMRKSSLSPKLYEFADMAVENESLNKSIAWRPISDYLKPYKGSKAYKEVAKFFGI